jgi:hypothetical protein
MNEIKEIDKHLYHLDREMTFLNNDAIMAIKHKSLVASAMRFLVSQRGIEELVYFCNNGKYPL